MIGILVPQGVYEVRIFSELVPLEQRPALDRADQLKLLFTALFHDSGKPATTVVDPETGRPRSPKHSLVGAEIARRVLRELGCDLTTREERVGQACSLPI